MSAGKKPKSIPVTPWPNKADKLHEENGWLWIPLRSEWRIKANKPEELVRQGFIRRLCQSYGYSLDQMDQERRTFAGSRSPRADIVVWESAAAKGREETPVLVVECKAESIEINRRDSTRARATRGPSAPSSSSPRTTASRRSSS